MVIYVAGLMNVPKDILEAASIDGANALDETEEDGIAAHGAFLHRMYIPFPAALLHGIRSEHFPD